MLYGADRSQVPRAQVAAARKEVDQISAQLDKLTDAMLASADEGTPAVFARRARQLEVDLAAAQAKLQAAELDLAGTGAHRHLWSRCCLAGAGCRRGGTGD